MQSILFTFTSVFSAYNLTGGGGSGGFESTLSQYGEYTSLLLIILSFFLLTAIAVRARTFRSLQFELFLFVLVLVVSELPRIAESLGLIQSDVFMETTGLVFHTISMVVLAGFLIYRARSFIGREETKEKEVGVGS